LPWGKQRGRARDPRDITFAGYQIIDLRTGGLVAGWGNADRGFALDLEGVEAWLRVS
jgi:hypothetical protein